MYGSIAQLGEHLPYKQRVTGSIPVVPTIYMAQWLSWLECRPVTPEVEGSSPFWVATCWCGSMVEQLICNQQVDGSIPFTSSSKLTTLVVSFLFAPKCYGLDFVYEM